MRALVTGATGFVGGHLLDALRREGAEVYGCCGPHESDERYASVDLAGERTLQAALAAFRPDVVFHLAAQTFVPDAMQTPLETYETNAMGTARLAQAIRGCDAPPRLIFASSAEVYGSRDAAEYPLGETLDLRPSNPYGASKAAAEVILLGEARGYGLDVVIARAFNHIGPGQSERFAVASFAGQLARIAAGAPPKMSVGRLDAARDFLDVRDVVAAYLALARRGERGEIYNVCSGKAVRIRDVLRELVTIARVPVEIVEDPARVRSVETPLSVGRAEKLRSATGWTAQVPLARSLRDLYDDARRRAGAGNRSETG